MYNALFEMIYNCRINSVNGKRITFTSNKFINFSVKLRSIYPPLIYYFICIDNDPPLFEQIDFFAVKSAKRQI